MLFAYYQIDTSTVFAAGKTLTELTKDLIKNNNVNDIDMDTLSIVSISKRDYDRIVKKGYINLVDPFSVLNIK